MHKDGIKHAALKESTFYLHFLAFDMVLISFSWELYWDEGNFKHVFHSNHVNQNNTNKT